MFTERSEFESVTSIVPKPHMKNSGSPRSLDNKLGDPRHTKRRQKNGRFKSLNIGDALTVTNAVEMDIDVGDAEIKQLLKKYIVEESNSEWSSPCILVSKANGSYRICSNMRKSNELIRAVSYPMRMIDDSIDRVVHNKIEHVEGILSDPVN